MVPRLQVIIIIVPSSVGIAPWPSTIRESDSANIEVFSAIRNIAPAPRNTDNAKHINSTNELCMNMVIISPGAGCVSWKFVLPSVIFVIGVDVPYRSSSENIWYGNSSASVNSVTNIPINK